MTRLFLDTNIVVDVAVKAKADIIITRNGKDFSASKLPVMTATEYLASIE